MRHTHTPQCKAALTSRIIQTICFGLSETDVNQIQMCFHQYRGCGELIMKWNWSVTLSFPVSWDSASLIHTCVCLYVSTCHVGEKDSSFLSNLNVCGFYLRCQTAGCKSSDWAAKHVVVEEHDHFPYHAADFATQRFRSGLNPKLNQRRLK